MIFTKLYNLALKFLLTLGFHLLFSNIAGRFYYRSLDNIPKDDIHTSDQSQPTITVDQFWDNAFKKSTETTCQYATRLTTLISYRITHINPKYMKPTFFENWILFIWSQKRGYYEWIDTDKAVRSGGGFCSQQAIIFNNIMREQKLTSRIISINGHVLNEAYLPEEQKWQVFDPDYNLTLPLSLEECESPENNHIIFNSYINTGISNNLTERIVNMFQTKEDNFNLKIPSPTTPTCPVKKTFLSISNGSCRSLLFSFPCPLYFCNINKNITESLPCVEYAAL